MSVLCGFSLAVIEYKNFSIDPWGAGFEICCVKKNKEKILTITKMVNGRPEMLMLVRYVSGEPEIIKYDETTAWDLYMEACLSDVKKKVAHKVGK